MTDPTASSAPIAAPKADPETLVLRAAPGRVTRFRRGAIVAIAAAGSTAIIGVAWLALKPATLSLIARSDEKLVGAKAPPDALAGAPTSVAATATKAKSRRGLIATSILASASGARIIDSARRREVAPRR